MIDEKKEECCGMIDNKPYVRRFVTPNKVVAATPFPRYDIETKVKSGFAQINQKNDLTALTAVASKPWQKYSFDQITHGTKIYVDASKYITPWAKKIYHLPELGDFILVPDEEIVLVTYGL